MDSYRAQVENYYILDMLWRLIQLWEDEYIYVRSFTDILKQYVKPLMDIAK